MTPEDRESIRRLLGPELLARVDALAADVGPAVAPRLVRLVLDVEDTAGDRGYVEAEREWQLVLAHLPGLALALTHIRAHVDGATWDCCTGTGTPQQQLRSEYQPHAPGSRGAP